MNLVHKNEKQCKLKFALLYNNFINNNAHADDHLTSLISQQVKSQHKKNLNFQRS